MIKHGKFALLLSAGVLVHAQEYRASLLGVVTDPSGAAVAGASIRVTNIESGVASPTVTNTDGSYLVPYLLPGRYSLLVERPGFEAFERNPIELRVNDRSRADVALEVGQVTDRVTVVAETPLLEIASSSRGQGIETRKITDLPLSGNRRHTAPQADLGLTRQFFVREGQRFEFKVSAYNATNTPIFNFPATDPSSPLFGVVPITQINNPRSVELGFRYAF